MSDPFERRKSAGSFKLPEGATGTIREFCARDDHLEIYTESQTFMAQTPESIDPDRTNPDVPWLVVKTDDVGSGHPAVARSFIMAYRVMKQAGFVGEMDKDAILDQMHVIKGYLVSCSRAAERFKSEVETEMQEFEATKGRLALNSAALERFPRVQDFEDQLTSMLVNAKRAVREVCLLVGMFFRFGRQHSSLTHVVRELTALRGASDLLVKFLDSRVIGCGRIISLRDGQEHRGTTGDRLHSDNFRMLPSNQIRAPVWNINEQAPFDIVHEMKEMTEFVIDLVELAFVGCVNARLSSQFPRMAFQQVPDPSPVCPIRFELVIDLSQFKFEPGPSAV